MTIAEINAVRRKNGLDPLIEGRPAEIKGTPEQIKAYNDYHKKENLSTVKRIKETPKEKALRIMNEAQKEGV